MVNKNNKLISQGFKQAEKITKKNSKTFYLCSFFLPKQKRLAAYSVYSICRLSDDAADISTNRKKDLAKIQDNIQKCYNNQELFDPILCAFRKTIQNYDIPKKYFDELLEGMSMDLEKTRYTNFDELYTYCYRVAGVIGLIMLKIFNYTNPLAELHAVELGIAFQLTNIARDIKEDFELGRIYIPKQNLMKHKITESDIKTHNTKENFKNLMIDHIKLTRLYYSKASRGIQFIADTRCRFVTFLMMTLYSEILNEIERNNYNIFSKKVFISLKTKIIKTLYCIVQFFKNDFLVSPPR
ncbi:MAG: phytoene/squalene synthase family protein [Candidatus Omnitrophica bacterium]|nr:phytoene/squalene synthase family protein [Candidatus Omnitrophota bacterium]